MDLLSRASRLRKNFLSSNLCSIPLWFLLHIIMIEYIKYMPDDARLHNFSSNSANTGSSESGHKASQKRIQKNEGHSQPGPLWATDQSESLFHR